MRKIMREEAYYLLDGGAILGGGGGGDKDGGIELIEEAFRLGEPTMVSLDEVDPDGIVVTMSAVGAPAAVDKFAAPEEYANVVRLLEEKAKKRIVALITNEMGAGSSFNAFLPSAVLGIPMLDAACNGRAHPLGTMGSMGLSENLEYVTIQTAAGGDPKRGMRLELTTEGSVAATSALVRSAAVEAGGLVAVARNPVTGSYIKNNAAIGAISRAIEVGKAYSAGKTAEEKLKAVAACLGGRIVATGKVENMELITEGGLDRGSFELTDGKRYRMTIWNEYMSLDLNGERIGTFPDLMMTFRADTGEPVTSAQLSEGDDVALLFVSRDELLLGGGMYEISGYQRIEGVLGEPILPYVEAWVKRRSAK